MSDIHITDKESPAESLYVGWSAPFGAGGLYALDRPLPWLGEHWSMFVGLPLALWAAEARTMCFRFLVDLRKNTPDPKSGSDVFGGKHR